MGNLPDWFMNYGNKPGAAPFVSPGLPMPPGASPPRLPDWLMRYGATPGVGTADPAFGSVGGASPYGALKAQGAADWNPTGGTPNQGVSQMGPGQQVNMVNPFGTPSVPQSSDPMAGYVATSPPPRATPSVPLPPVHNGGNWATTAALEGDPAGQPVWASAANLRDQMANGRALPDWATPDAQKAMAAENRQIGPGSWFDPSKLSGMVGKNSLFGKLMALRNPSDAPTGPAPNHTGLLSGLFNDGAPLGRSLTEPNSTIGGLW